MTTIVGLDVSSYQKDFNWKQAAQQGIHFGICKLTEGTGYVDAAFDYHWNAIREAGLARGCYGFARWDQQTEPTAEAQFFLGHLPPLEAGDVIALDIEASPDQVPAYELSAWALTWLLSVERALGFRPMVYSGYSFASAFLTDALLGSYGLWVADYGPPQCPAPVGPWPLVAMWQRTSSAAYAGTTVDESLFFGSVEQLRAYGKPAPVPQAPSSPASRAASGGPAGASGKARFLITRDMMARSEPVLGAVIWQQGKPQMVFKGAVLDAVPGPEAQTPHWAQVIAGGHPVWVYLANTRPV